MRHVALAAAALAFALGAGARTASAAEYRSIATPAAVLWDSPSEKGRRIFVAPRGMPVEVLSSLPNWVKVRDFTGDAFWVRPADLGPARTVVAQAPVTLRASPQDAAAPVVQVDRGVLLEVLDASPSGWVRVRHRDGATGWVRANELWGA